MKIKFAHTFFPLSYSVLTHREPKQTQIHDNGKAQTYHCHGTLLKYLDTWHENPTESAEWPRSACTLGGKYLQREVLDASFLSRNKARWPPLNLGQTLPENGNKGDA